MKQGEYQRKLELCLRKNVSVAELKAWLIRLSDGNAVFAALTHCADGLNDLVKKGR
jgi:hypothetical protein